MRARLAVMSSPRQPPPTNAPLRRLLKAERSLLKSLCTTSDRHGETNGLRGCQHAPVNDRGSHLPVLLPASLPLASTEHAGHLSQQTSITRLRQTTFCCQAWPYRKSASGVDRRLCVSESASGVCLRRESCQWPSVGGTTACAPGGGKGLLFTGGATWCFVSIFSTPLVGVALRVFERLQNFFGKRKISKQRK